MARMVSQQPAAHKGTPEPAVSPHFVDKVRDAIIGRVSSADQERALEHACPDAVDLLAEAIAPLHDAINGHSAELAGNRPASYFRKQLRGEKPITDEDISRLAIQAPAELVTFLAPILRRVAAGAPDAAREIVTDLAPLVGLAVGSLQPTQRDIGAARAAAHVIEDVAPLAAAVIRDEDDNGCIDEDHLPQLQKAKDALAELEEAVMRRRRA